MTGTGDEMTDELTAALARTLRHHAGEAPSADGLAEKAMALTARRRRGRLNASIAAIVVLVVGIPLAVVAAVNSGDGTPTAAHPTWRWESYRGVQVQVPPDWVYGVPGITWCGTPAEGETRPVRPGVVDRPGMPTTATGCSPESARMVKRENSVAFNTRDEVGVRGLDHGWVEETRRVNGVFVTVASNDGRLRSAVLGSAVPVVGTDHYGCPTRHPVAEDPDGYRPTEGELPPAGTVESISVCRYALPENDLLRSKPGATLLSSGRIAGEDAKRVVNAILAAPEGVGPDVDDADRGHPASDGTEIAVLRVETTDGAREVVVRYSGELGNSFDDGRTKRRLTADGLRPLLTGANRAMQFYVPVAPLLDDH